MPQAFVYQFLILLAAVVGQYFAVFSAICIIGLGWMVGQIVGQCLSIFDIACWVVLFDQMEMLDAAIFNGLLVSSIGHSSIGLNNNSVCIGIVYPYGNLDFSVRQQP